MEHQPHSYANEHAPFEGFPPFTKKQAEEIETIAGEGKSDVSSVNGKTGAIIGVLFNEAGTVPATVLKAAELTGAQIAAGTIESGNIKAGAIVAAALGAEAVGTAALAAKAVTGAKVAVETLTAENQASESTIARVLGKEAVTTEKIKLLAVTEGLLAGEAVSTAKIKLLNVTTGTLAEGAVTAIKLGAESVTEAKIAAKAVTGAKIAAGTIESGNIKAEAVTETQLQGKSVNATKVFNPTKPVAGGENTVVVGTAGVPRQIVAAVKGNGVATAFKVKHNLETQIAAVNILSATFEEPVTMLAKSVAISLSEIEVTFTIAPGAGVVNYVVITG